LGLRLNKDVILAYSKVPLDDLCLIGCRVSILSKDTLHELDENGMWTPYSAERLLSVTISKNVWIGERAIVSADVGESCMIGASSVVSSTIKSNIMVAGDPARFVKNFSLCLRRKRIRIINCTTSLLVLVPNI
jgi:acetyltransferase-like isoleucine patch superfamily enzyme